MMTKKQQQQQQQTNKTKNKPRKQKPYSTMQDSVQVYERNVYSNVLATPVRYISKQMTRERTRSLYIGYFFFFFSWQSAKCWAVAQAKCACAVFTGTSC